MQAWAMTYMGVCELRQGLSRMEVQSKLGNPQSEAS